MKQYLKRLLEVIAVGILTAVVIFVSCNSQALANRINNYEAEYLQPDDMELFHWEETFPNKYVSESDPQIILPDVNCYVNNLSLNGTIENVRNADSKVLIYYTENTTETFSGEKVIRTEFKQAGDRLELSIKKKVYSLRIDITEDSSALLTLTGIYVNPNAFTITKWGILLGILVVLGAFFIFHYRLFFRELYTERELLVTLIKNDLKARYAGSFLGMIWALIQPLLTILVFWLVFELGFRSAPVNNVNFILWFIPAYIPWIYFQDSIVNSTGCLREYSYLVKKMKFKIEILPIVKVFSGLIIHTFFFVFMLLIFALYRFRLSLMAFQLLYYAAALTFLLMGLSWLTSAVAVFMKDFMQIINIILQLGFFMIPVFWNDADMQPVVLSVLKLNPVYYIVQGYRDSILNGTPFWDRPLLTIYYWLVTFIVFALGTRLFYKSRRHFADLI